MTRGPEPAGLHLSEAERANLEGFVRRHNVSQAIIQRARINSRGQSMEFRLAGCNAHRIFLKWHC